MYTPKLRWLAPLAGILTLAVVDHLQMTTYHKPCSDLLWTGVGEEFEGFDNETGVQTGDYIVPNIIHFLRMGPKLKQFNFIDTVCVLAALKNHRPEKIFFHTDHKNFTGSFWEELLKTEGFANIIEFIPTELPSEIFGEKFSKNYHLFHAGDILRIRLLMKYGGIFLDNDSFLVRSLDVFRKYEFAVSWDEGKFLGTQILLAHKDARFLRLWLESYRDNYHPDLWYYNAGERPTKTILYSRPELVHRVKLLFGTHIMIKEIYQMVWQEWRKQFAIHLLIRHYEPVRREHFSFRVEGKELFLPEEFTKENILQYPITLRELVKDVYPF